MIKNDNMKDINKIVITRDENNDRKVICRAFTSDGGMFTCDATCSPDDIFDFNIGAKLAMDGLYDGYDMTPKSKRKPYNGKIFVRADVRNLGFIDVYECIFKEPAEKYTRENKIWEVKDGKIICFDRKTDIIYEDMTDEELTKLLCSTNNGFQGFFYNINDGYFVR